MKIHIMHRNPFATARYFCALLLPALALTAASPAKGENQKVCDISQAKEICRTSPLQGPEGIWVYPDDNVTVLVLKEPGQSPSSLAKYAMTVVDSTDGEILPGETLGWLEECPERDKYRMTVATTRKDGKLMHPKSCTATLSKDADAIILSKDKAKVSLRFSLSPTVLLPGMWKFIRVSANGNSNRTNTIKPGMVKIYPPYGNNGVQRRNPRYL